MNELYKIAGYSKDLVTCVQMSVICIGFLFLLQPMCLRVKGGRTSKPQRLRKPLAIDAVLITVIVIKARVITITITITTIIIIQW